MSKDNKKKDKILKSEFFLKLFLVPSICISVTEFMGMFSPDELGEEPVKWSYFFVRLIFLLIIWFGISFIISLIINEVKNGKSKTKIVKEIQYINKQEEIIAVKPEELKENIKKEKMRKLNNKCLYTCESKLMPLN